jgi:formylmethanofuran dehydrogenase subunit E
MKRAALAWILCIVGCTGLGAAMSDGSGSHHDHGPRAGDVVEVTTPAATRLREFHGHVGPYVVIGYRMGMAARRILGTPGYFDLTAHLETPLAPPPSCFIDGVQIGSGCTTGKRNLTVFEGQIARGTFTTRAGKSAILALRPELPGKIREWIESEGVEATGARLLEFSDDELFVVESP